MAKYDPKVTGQMFEQGVTNLGEAIFGNPGKQADWELKKNQTAKLGEDARRGKMGNDALSRILEDGEFDLYNTDEATGKRSMRNPDEIRDIMIRMAPMYAAAGFDNPGAITGAMSAYTGNDDLQRSGLIGRGVQTNENFAGSAKRADQVAARDNALATQRALAVAQAKGGKASKEATGREQMTDLVGQLAANYDTLKEQGAISNPDNSLMQNVSAFFKNSYPGQAMGKMFGTEEQTTRNDISMTKPLLLQAVKNATGMSATQMNTDKELQFFLQAATDPSLGYEANKTALERLNRLYGKGDLFNAGQTQQVVTVVNPDTAEVLQIDPSDLDSAIADGWVPQE